MNQILHNSFFFFNDTATTKIYTLSLHDALPISTPRKGLLSHTSILAHGADDEDHSQIYRGKYLLETFACMRSEEHTSELQSRLHLVCRLLLEKKKTQLNFIRVALDNLIVGVSLK